MYTLGQAARATGKSKSTISHAIKTGKISATPQPNGSYIIDPAELHRVYDPVPVQDGVQPDELDDTEPLELSNETGGLKSEVQRLRERLQGAARALEQSEAERERERRQLADEINYLRDSLKTEGEERRKLTAILTAPAAPKADTAEPSPAPQISPPRGFWARLARKDRKAG